MKIPKSREIKNAMFQHYHNYWTPRQKQLLRRFLKSQNRIQRNISDGSFATMTRRKQRQLLSRLRRYTLQLQRLGYTLRFGAAGFSLALSLVLTNPATAQTLTEQTGSNNPFNGVDVGFYSTPTFVDIDNDGDFDAFIGKSNGQITYFKNMGNNTSATFTDTNNNPLDVDIGAYSTPTFVDIDNDGDFDAFIGDEVGTIFYFKNVGNNTTALFTVQSGSNDPFDGTDVGINSRPVFVDIDNDGDFDAFIGEAIGNINYYKNTGTNTSATFSEQTGSNNPFDGANVGGYSNPAFVDIDNDGDFDAFFGEFNGTIKYYKNTGTNTSATFTEQTGSNNPFDGVDVGYMSAPTFVDIDNDSDFDAFIGDNVGTIRYFKNVTPLPVELVDFSAMSKNREVVLRWQTASELNNDGFEVQRAAGNVALKTGRWEVLAFVEGNGSNGGEIQNYRFTDGHPQSGFNYYRLKQMDFDGKFEYSDIVSVDMLDVENSATLMVYPNPTSEGEITLYLPESIDGESTILLYDEIGELVLRQTTSSQKERLKVSQLPKGMYFVEVATGHSFFWEKVEVD